MSYAAARNQVGIQVKKPTLLFNQTLLAVLNGRRMRYNTELRPRVGRCCSEAVAAALGHKYQYGGSGIAATGRQCVVCSRCAGCGEPRTREPECSQTAYNRRELRLGTANRQAWQAGRVRLAIKAGRCAAKANQGETSGKRSGKTKGRVC